MQVIETAMSRSRTVVLSLVVVLFAGVVAYLTIPKEAEPDIEIPFIYVMRQQSERPGRAVRQLVLRLSLI